MKTVNQLIAAALVISALGSCGKEEIAKNSSAGADPTQSAMQQDTQTGNENNTRAVTMTGSPGEETSGYGTILFEIEKVEAYVQGSGWVVLNSEEQSINTMELENGADWTIASTGNVDASLIRDLRITFGDQNYLNADGSFSSNIITMNFQQAHEVLVHIDETLQSEESIALNLDLGASIVESAGSFFFQPSIQFMGDASTGIRGLVQGVEQATIQISNGSQTFTTYLSSNGEFIIRDLAAGSYDILIEPQSEGILQLSDKKISGVTVVEGRITNTSQIVF